MKENIKGEKCVKTYIKKKKTKKYKRELLKRGERGK